MNLLPGCLGVAVLTLRSPLLWGLRGSLSWGGCRGPPSAAGPAGDVDTGLFLQPGLGCRLRASARSAVAAHGIVLADGVVC